MNVHLIDGTYELFRHYFGAPSTKDANGREVGAIVGVLGSMARMLADGTTHIAVATDHVVESFRNELWPGYKTGTGLEPELWGQFHPLEEALVAMGIQVWPMVELEADDGLASGARIASEDPRVDRVFICTPDKDLSQSVRGTRVVQFDRRKGEVRDEAGVIAKFGVPPDSIPDYLALVGDSADGFPGVPGWGAKSSATLLAHYLRLDQIPSSPDQWEVTVRGKERLARALRENMADALLFRDLATLRTDAPLMDNVDEIAWQGPSLVFGALTERLGAKRLGARVASLAKEFRR
ncbi:MAG: 5'-3' exonuclease [Longimicrobiales bacterium]